MRVFFHHSLKFTEFSHWIEYHKTCLTIVFCVSQKMWCVFFWLSLYWCIYICPFRMGTRVYGREIINILISTWEIAWNCTTDWFCYIKNDKSSVLAKISDFNGFHHWIWEEKFDSTVFPRPNGKENFGKSKLSNFACPRNHFPILIPTCNQTYRRRNPPYCINKIQLFFCIRWWINLWQTIQGIIICI